MKKRLFNLCLLASFLLVFSVGELLATEDDEDRKHRHNKLLLLRLQHAIAVADNAKEKKEKKEYSNIEWGMNVRKLVLRAITSRDLKEPIKDWDEKHFLSMLSSLPLFEFELRTFPYFVDNIYDGEELLKKKDSGEWQVSRKEFSELISSIEKKEKKYLKERMLDDFNTMVWCAISYIRSVTKYDIDANDGDSKQQKLLAQLTNMGKKLKKLLVEYKEAENRKLKWWQGKEKRKREEEMRNIQEQMNSIFEGRKKLLNKEK